jgi:hypothetical protein
MRMILLFITGSIAFPENENHLTFGGLSRIFF